MALFAKKKPPEPAAADEQKISLAAIAMIKVRLNMIDKLQEKTLYDGQSEYYRNLQ